MSHGERDPLHGLRPVRAPGDLRRLALGAELFSQDVSPASWIDLAWQDPRVRRAFAFSCAALLVLHLVVGWIFEPPARLAPPRTPPPADAEEASSSRRSLAEQRDEVLEWLRES